MTEITLDHIELAILNLLAGGHPIRWGGRTARTQAGAHAAGDAR